MEVVKYRSPALVLHEIAMLSATRRSATPYRGRWNGQRYEYPPLPGKPGEYILSLPEEVRAVLRTLTSKDAANIRDDVAVIFAEF